MLKLLRNFTVSRKMSQVLGAGEQGDYYYTKPETKISVKNLKINYLKVGSGDHAVLCLPGALGTIWTDFSAQIAGFDLEKYTLVVWDPPGYGLSRCSERDFTPGYLSRDADTAAALMKVLKIPRYSLLGWSDGGITSICLAGKYPENVKKLVIWGANAYISNEDLLVYEKVRNTSDWSHSMRSTMEKVYGAEGLKRIMNDWVDSMIHTAKENNGDLCREMLPKIKAPTFILHGAKDPLVPTFHVEYLKQNIKNCKVHVFQDGKHNIHIKYAEEFNRLVQDFLAETDQKSNL